jgi:hypothetical protein
MKMKVATVLLACGLSACTTAPVISDLESDKIKIQYAGADTTLLMNEANRGCAIHSKDAVGPISSMCIKGPYSYFCETQEYLFACQ